MLGEALSHARWSGDERTTPAPVAAHEDEDEMEALRVLVELLLSADGKSVPVRIACDDGTIKDRSGRN